MLAAGGQSASTEGAGGLPKQASVSPRQSGPRLPRCGPQHPPQLGTCSEMLTFWIPPWEPVEVGPSACWFNKLSRCF